MKRIIKVHKPKKGLEKMIEMERLADALQKKRLKEDKNKPN